MIHFYAVAGLPNSIRASRHLSPTSPFVGFSRTSIFSIPLMVSEAFSMLVIAAQIAALDPLMVHGVHPGVRAMVYSPWATRGVDIGADARLSA